MWFAALGAIYFDRIKGQTQGGQVFGVFPDPVIANKYRK
jgi:hypothetical protein